MNLAAVMDEIAEVMSALTKVNVKAHPPDSITPDAGVVGYPQSIDYDATYGRGLDTFTDLPIWLITGKVTSPTARDKVARWSAGAGPESIKARMEAHAWTTCDDLTVTAVEFSTVDIGGVEYLAAIFTATVVGPGGA
jgi:hypothetical protein